MKGSNMLHKTLAAGALLFAVGAAQAQAGFGLWQLAPDESKAYYQAAPGSDWRLARDTQAMGADCRQRAQALVYDLTAPANYSTAFKQQLAAGKPSALNLAMAQFPTLPQAQACARVLRQRDLTEREQYALNTGYASDWSRHYWFGAVPFAAEVAGLAQRLVTQDRVEPGEPHCVDLDDYAKTLESQQVCYRPLMAGAAFGTYSQVLPTDCGTLPGSRHLDGTPIPGAASTTIFRATKPALKRAVGYFGAAVSDQFCGDAAKTWLDKAVEKTAKEPKAKPLYELLAP